MSDQNKYINEPTAPSVVETETHCSDFHFQTPVNIYFGKDAVKNLPELVKGKGNVLLVYGGVSAKLNGAYSSITATLTDNNLKWIELPGCIGPHYSYVKQGISLCREHNVGCVIGIGGCSCMDIAKMIAFGATNEDIWDYLTFSKPVTGKEKRLLIGSVPTYPSGGSEADETAEIDDLETGEHGTLYGIYSDFSILNPEFTYTLTARQSAFAGAVTFIQASVPFLGGSFPLTDSFTLGIMNMIRKSIVTVKSAPENYEARATQMWASALTTSKLLYCGKDMSWCGSLYNDVEIIRICMPLQYREAFTVLFPEWLRSVGRHHLDDVSRYLTSIFPELDSLDIINDGCDKLKQYFKEIGLPMSYSEYGKVPEEVQLRTAAEELKDGSILSIDELVEMFQRCL